MTDSHPAPIRNVSGRATQLLGASLALLLAGLMLQGCAEKTATAAGPRVYLADLQGQAKQCDAPKLTPAAGQTADVAMKLGNDGGWCGVSVSPNGPGLLISRPAHGTVNIHQVGDVTRIDYTPARGFAGSDNFAVKIVP
ncbi:MAG TPA: Ig-like domain-containing protein, partial [Rhodopila sp.]|nr:Ig-like domain-containing protein [Rhodopila sp.]